MELPKTSATVGCLRALARVMSRNSLPPGMKISFWVGRSAPPDSTRETVGRPFSSAICGGPEDLLDRPRVAGAALHRRVVGGDQALDALDHADAGDHAGADGEVRAPAGQRATARGRPTPRRSAARSARAAAACRARGGGRRTSPRRRRPPWRARRRGRRAWRASPRGWLRDGRGRPPQPSGTPSWPTSSTGGAGSEVCQRCLGFHDRLDPLQRRPHALLVGAGSRAFPSERPVEPHRQCRLDAVVLRHLGGSAPSAVESVAPVVHRSCRRCRPRTRRARRARTR